VCGSISHELMGGELKGLGVDVGGGILFSRSSFLVVYLRVLYVVSASLHKNKNIDTQLVSAGLWE